VEVRGILEFERAGGADILRSGRLCRRPAGEVSRGGGGAARRVGEVGCLARGCILGVGAGGGLWAVALPARGRFSLGGGEWVFGRQRGLWGGGGVWGPIA